MSRRRKQQNNNNNASRASTQSKKKTKNKVAKTANALSAMPRTYQLVSSNSKRFVESLLMDRLAYDCHLPAFGFQQPFATITNEFRGQFVAGNALEASLVLNPYLLWTDYLAVERIVNNTRIAQYVSTLLTNSTGTQSGFLPEGATNMYVSNAGTNQYNTSTLAGYTAFVRPHGVRIRVIYTGTKLNEGGAIMAIHNPHHTSLLAWEDADTSASSDSPFKSIPTSNSQLGSWLDRVSTHQLGDTFEFVWRPDSFAFKSMSSYLPMEDMSVAALNAVNPAILQQGYMAAEAGTSGTNLLATRAERGWVTGIKVIPAAGTPGTLIPYTWEVSAQYDICIVRSVGASGASTGSSATAGQRLAAHNPLDEAHIHNALAIAHQQRSMRVPSRSAKNLGVVSSLKAAGQSAMLGAAESVGEQFASRAAALF